MPKNCRQELETRSNYLRCVCGSDAPVSKSPPGPKPVSYLPLVILSGGIASHRSSVDFGCSLYKLGDAPRLSRDFGASRQFLPNSPTRYPPSKANRSATGSFKRLASLSKVSNDGAFLPRSIRLRKSTDMSSVSANCSWVIRRCARICRKRRPNFSLRVVTWTLFPSYKNLSQRTFAFAFLPQHACWKWPKRPYSVFLL
jgi:hypothetical protein